jgi:enamine deaminase RidA (YjgF/YER057c/UK114 family)
MKPLRLLILGFALVAVLLSWQRKKKNEEEITQTLELPPDPPHAVIAETRRLEFHVTPLTGKGLLSQQVRDALKNLLRETKGSTVVKLRAFVAGSGDVRRVQSIVSDTFADKKQPIPALTVVQVGGLPLVGAQVVFESVAVVRKKEVNPGGLAFISGQAYSAGGPIDPAAPLATKALADLSTAVTAAGAVPKDVLRVSCFLNTLSDVNSIRTMVASQFPSAAADFVQIQRAPLHAVAECEAVARLQRPGAEPLKFLNPPGLKTPEGYSQIALVSADRIALTGTQISFGYEQKDARLAMERLGKDLEEVKGSLHDVAMAHIYPLSSSLAEEVRRVRFDFFDPVHPPASTMLPFEGLPAMEAGFALDVICVLK